MIKTTIQIEGQICDLADVFKALATVAAASPRPEPVITSDVKPHVELSGNLSDRLVGEGKVYIPSTDTCIELNSKLENTTEEQEDPEQTDADGKPKRKRRTKEQIEADRLAAEQAAQDNATAPADEVSQGQTEFEKEEYSDQSGEIVTVGETVQETDQTADFPSMVKENVEPVVTSNGVAPTNPLLAGINFDGPYIETMRKASQLMIAKNPANKDLILDLLTEFNAKGLSEVKDEDKAAFKIRFKELPFKG